MTVEESSVFKRGGESMDAIRSLFRKWWEERNGQKRSSSKRDSEKSQRNDLPAGSPTHKGDYSDQSLNRFVTKKENDP